MINVKIILHNCDDRGKYWIEEFLLEKNKTKQTKQKKTRKKKKEKRNRGSRRSPKIRARVRDTGTQARRVRIPTDRLVCLRDRNLNSYISGERKAGPERSRSRERKSEREKMRGEEGRRRAVRGRRGEGGRGERGGSGGGRGGKETRQGRGRGARGRVWRIRGPKLGAAALRERRWW